MVSFFKCYMQSAVLYMYFKCMPWTLFRVHARVIPGDYCYLIQPNIWLYLVSGKISTSCLFVLLCHVTPITINTWPRLLFLLWPHNNRRLIWCWQEAQVPYKCVYWAQRCYQFLTNDGNKRSFTIAKITNKKCLFKTTGHRCWINWTLPQ